MLSLAGVSRRFEAVQTLDECSFSVERGRMVGFLGPNGAGKTTAMRTIFRLVEPDAGAVLWNGKPVGLAEQLSFGYMPEERGLYPRMQVAEQLAYFGALHGLDDTAARGAAANLAGAARPRRPRRCEGRATASGLRAARFISGFLRASPTASSAHSTGKSRSLEPNQ